MRIAVFSDIHGNLPALEACWAHLQDHGGADLVVNCGDILSGPLWPAETADWLMAQPWPTIAGNHERQALACGTQPDRAHARSDRFAFERMSQAHREWFAALPGTLDLTAHGRDAASHGVMVCHGQPAVDYEYLLETVTPEGSRMATAAEVAERLASPAAQPAFAQASLVLCGHSHLPRAIQTASGTLCVNPGSVGLPAFDDDHRHFHTHQTGTPHARYAVCERAAGTTAWSVSFCNVAYDWRAASAKAAAAGFDAWARWLATGYA